MRQLLPILSPLATAALAALLTCAASGASAQAGKTLGGGTASTNTPVLSKEELRACLRQQDDLQRRRTELDTQEKALAAERPALLAELDTLKTEQAALSERNTAVRDLNARMTAYQGRIDAWNERMQKYNEDVTRGRAMQSDRTALANEEAALKKEGVALDAERTRLASLTGDAESLNQRSQAQAAKSEDWNARSARSRQSIEAYENDRDAWRTNCGNRRYREDDEKALRAGK